jgi:hypothetical protein
MFLRLIATTALASACLAATADRTYTGSRQSVSINGVAMTGVRAAQGGDIYADVLNDGGPGPGGAVPKHLGPVHYEDITLQVAPHSPVAQQIVRTMLAGNAQPVSGSILTSSFDLQNVLSDLQFTNALPVEFTLPALDGSSKDAGSFTIKLAPEMVRLGKGGGGASAGKGEIGDKAKAWLTSNFRIEIDNLPANRVARVESLTVRNGAAASSGETAARDGIKRVAGPLDLPLIRLSLSAADAPAWQTWFDDFVIQGKNDAAHEKNGAIVLLAPDLKTELLRFNLYNIGIARFAPEPRDAAAAAETVARYRAELYFERIELPGSGSLPPAPKQQESAAAPAASQPAPAPAQATARASDLFVIQPNLKLDKSVGRIVVRYPADMRQRDNQRVRFPKERADANAEINWGSVAKEMPPGTCLVSINNKLVEGVPVQGGADTVMRVGVLRLDLPEGQTWEIIEEDLDSAPAMHYAGGPADVALPPGKYFLRTKSEISPVTIEDGKIATFPSAPAPIPAATPAPAPASKTDTRTRLTPIAPRQP